MNKLKNFITSGIMFVLFIVYTLLVKLVDVKPIGPLDSKVGFASINSFFANIFPYTESFYKITKVVAVCSFLCIACFAFIGLYQLITRKSLKKVDLQIYGMAGIYAVTAFFYVLFEIIVINYRPILEEGELEASFPSSHTMLAVSVFGSALTYCVYYVDSRLWSSLLTGLLSVLMVAMAGGRLFSGVHWFTDILGGMILGACIISLYISFIKSFCKY